MIGPVESVSVLSAPTRASAISSRAAWLGTTVLLVVVVAAILAPTLIGFSIWGGYDAPLTAFWRPRVAPATWVAVAFAVVLAGRLPGFAARGPWRGVLVVSTVASLAWMIVLALVDGVAGLDAILGRTGEYLQTARATTEVGRTLQDYVARIPYSAAPHNWPTHIAGHPPGALLFFVGLDRLGLAGDLAAALVVILLAATIPAAVLITVRRLGAEQAARRAAPFVTVGPAAIWSAVSADAMFAAVAAWGLCALAIAATTGRRRQTMSAVVAGLLLGYCVYLSYGLPLLGLPALAVLLAARSWRPLACAVSGALAVAGAFTLTGFRWWEAYPVLSERYFAGAAHLRPGTYWTWADLALLGFNPGPVTGAVIAGVAVRARAALRGRLVADVRVPVLLALAALSCTVLAAVSQMSRSETERIFLPFIPWILCASALLDGRWRRCMFAVQLAAAIAIQSLYFTSW